MATWKETDGFTDAQVAVLNNLSDDRYGKVDTPIVDDGEIYNWQNSVFRTQLTQLNVEILREMVYIIKYKTFNNNHDFSRDLTITYDSNSDYTTQEKSWIEGWKFKNREKIGMAMVKAKRLSALSYADQTIIDLLGESL
tara:strand:+ start:778 stop:1194 length:417 start_codon:yes stop_codon:yes gene_type:complete